jgi:hypothetical protein
MATVTKNQHYVPQLLLRNFATNDRVVVYDLARSQYRVDQHVRGVCSENYLYDQDNSVEKILSEQIEGPAAGGLKKLTEPHIDVRQPSTELLTFMRTPEAFDQIMGFIQSGADALKSSADALIKSIYEQNEWEGRRPRLELTINSGRSTILSYAALESSLSVPLISDLAGCLLWNDSIEEFIVSDHPVFQTNSYLNGSDDPRAASIAAKGTQFFMPISPTLTYCLYDPKIYAYRGQSGYGVIHTSLEDVLILNEYQAQNARSFLVARSDRMKNRLENLASKKSPMKSIKSVTETSAPYFVDDEQRSMQITVRRLPAVAHSLTFVRVKNKIRRQTLDVGYRNDELARQHEAWLKDWQKRRNS